MRMPAYDRSCDVCVVAFIQISLNAGLLHLNMPLFCCACCLLRPGHLGINRIIFRFGRWLFLPGLNLCPLFCAFVINLFVPHSNDQSHWHAKHPPAWHELKITVNHVAAANAFCQLTSFLPSLHAGAFADHFCAVDLLLLAICWTGTLTNNFIWGWAGGMIFRMNSVPSSTSV